MFSQRGYQATTMAEIAREAGISPGAIYRYFESKDQLALGCFSQGMRTVHDQWLERGGPSGDPIQEIEDLSRLTFALLNDPEQQSETILALEQLLSLVRSGDEDGLAAVRATQREIIDGLSHRLSRAQAAGLLARNLDPDHLARALMAFYWGARLARLADRCADTDAQFEQIATLLANSKPPSSASALA